MSDPSAPSAFELWNLAAEDHPNDPAARQARYLDLMRQHGHVVTREPGDDRPLFSCGYTGWRSRFPRAVERRHRAGDPRRLVGSITHGGPNQWKCGACDGTGDHIEVYQPPLGGPPERSVEPCPDCNGEGWYVLAT